MALQAAAVPSECAVFLMDIGWTPPLIGGHPDDQNLQWSLDSRLIAFTSPRDGNREIYIMNVDGSNQRRLTGNPATDPPPLWLLGGEHIAFRSDRGGVRAIYVMRTEGTELRKIVDSYCHPERWLWDRIAVFPE